jgi:stearoyl-CoA desaturase (delta-9 desaturase)
VVYPSALPFALMHLACFAALWTGVTWRAALLGFALYWLRMFGIGAGYHRYFSHRAFKTGRVFQFFLACLAQSTTQKSVLWWGAKHRHHHAWSDTPADVHSPRQKGFLYAHMGWIFTPRHDVADLTKIEDFARYPELMWLHRYEQAPAIALAMVCYLIAGWPGLVVGFCWSTVAVYHGTFCINSLAHVHGRKRYLTGDDSRNNWLLALMTMGEGWHNNHHAFQSAARQGFFWWEFDPTYYILLGLSKIGIVRDLKQPPQSVLENRYFPSGRVLDRAASDLVASFDLQAILARLRAHAPDADLRRRLLELQQAAHDFASLHNFASLQGLPSYEELRARARTLFVETHSLDDICARAHSKIIEALGARLAAA